jgi:hypothetical protein
MFHDRALKGRASQPAEKLNFVLAFGVLAFGWRSASPLR